MSLLHTSLALLLIGTTRLDDEQIYIIDGRLHIVVVV
jgi:hypothetical protein